jgi:hypothetical protein
MAKARRHATEWATLIEQWRQSSLSLPAFCQHRGLSRGTMQNWVYKPSLRHAVEQARGQARPIDLPFPDSPLLPEPSPSFLPVRIAEAPQRTTVSQRTGIEVILELGRRIAISDKGVAHLGRLPRLRLLDINISPLIDEGLGHLADLPSLEELTVQGKKFTDQSLIHLSRAKRLKSLMLRPEESEISDAGLEHLKGLTNLRRLHLGKSKITKEARERLLKAMPNLEFAL